jgi:hypothetical protein
MKEHTFQSGGSGGKNIREAATRRQMGNNVGVTLLLTMPTNTQKAEELTPSLEARQMCQLY